MQEVAEAHDTWLRPTTPEERVWDDQLPEAEVALAGTEETESMMPEMPTASRIARQCLNIPLSIVLTPSLNLLRRGMEAKTLGEETLPL
jgi:hypothetical protein